MILPLYVGTFGMKGMLGFFEAATENGDLVLVEYILQPLELVCGSFCNFSSYIRR